MLLQLPFIASNGSVNFVFEAKRSEVNKTNGFQSITSLFDVLRRLMSGHLEATFLLKKFSVEVNQIDRGSYRLTAESGHLNLIVPTLWLCGFVRSNLLKENRTFFCTN